MGQLKSQQFLDTDKGLHSLLEDKHFCLKQTMAKIHFAEYCLFQSVQLDASSHTIKPIQSRGRPPYSLIKPIFIWKSFLKFFGSLSLNLISCIRIAARLLLVITFEDQFRQLPLCQGQAPCPATLRGDFLNLENGLIL